MSGATALSLSRSPWAPLVTPLVRVAILPGDDPLVGVGDGVSPGTPIVRRPRHAQVVEQPLHGRTAPAPGTRFEDGIPLAGKGGRSLRFEGSGEVLCTTPSGRVRAVVSRHQAILVSPASGRVESLDRCSLDIRTEGPAVRAALAVGDPSHGPLALGVESPDGELRANRIDVRHAGSVLVAGSRVDVEGLTRARAMGARGVIVGGVAGGDLLAFRASIERQEAAIHASPAFALLVLDGLGKRPIPWPAWEMLRAAEGREVGLSITPALVLFEPGSGMPVAEPDRVRLTAGPALGRTGRLVRLIGTRRQPGGLYQECARVALDPVSLPGSLELVDVALADLERNG
ncbi:MAG: hypothetical protein ACP5VP_03160 [Candidatus Limnocylindrales bacterium]